MLSWPIHDNETHKSSFAAIAPEADRLRHEAGYLLYNRELPPDNKQHRTWSCGRFAIIKGDMPVLRSKTKGARLASVTTCGSVWTCPVCAQKITAARIRALDEAILEHRVNQGSSVYLMTLTIPHRRNQGLAELLFTFDEVKRKFFNSRCWKGAMNQAHYKGIITALEVKWGSRNGWHPHAHVLMFCDEGLGVDVAVGPGRQDMHCIRPVVAALQAEWMRQLENAGLLGERSEAGAMQCSLVVTPGERAAGYMVKGGRIGGLQEEGATFADGGAFTPFELLDQSAKGNKQAGALFREYAEAIAGKRMLAWSRGLRERLCLVSEKSDEKLAVELAKKIEDERVVGHINQAQLNVLTWSRAQGHFLAFVAVHGGHKDIAALIPYWISLCALSGRVKGTRRMMADHFAGLAARVLAAPAANEADVSGDLETHRMTA